MTRFHIIDDHGATIQFDGRCVVQIQCDAVELGDRRVWFELLGCILDDGRWAVAIVASQEGRWRQDNVQVCLAESLDVIEDFVLSFDFATILPDWAIAQYHYEKSAETLMVELRSQVQSRPAQPSTPSNESLLHHLLSWIHASERSKHAR